MCIMRIIHLITIFRIIACFQGWYEGTIEGFGFSFCYGCSGEQEQNSRVPDCIWRHNKAPLSMPDGLIMTSFCAYFVPNYLKTRNRRSGHSIELDDPKQCPLVEHYDGCVHDALNHLLLLDGSMEPHAKHGPPVIFFATNGNCKYWVEASPPVLLWYTNINYVFYFSYWLFLFYICISYSWRWIKLCVLSWSRPWTCQHGTPPATKPLTNSLKPNLLPKSICKVHLFPPHHVGNVWPLCNFEFSIPAKGTVVKNIFLSNKNIQHCSFWSTKFSGTWDSNTRLKSKRIY